MYGSLRDMSYNSIISLNLSSPFINITISPNLHNHSILRSINHRPLDYVHVVDLDLTDLALIVYLRYNE